MKETRIPGKVDVPTRFFGSFTAKDLVRLGLPILLTATLVSGESLTGLDAVLLLAGVACGVIWNWWRPYDQPVDAHFVNMGRWLYRWYRFDGYGYQTDSDNAVITGDGAAVAIIEITPTNLELKTEAEQAALQSTLQHLYQTIDYPLTIHSRQQPLDLEPYIQHLEQNEADSQVGEAYQRYCQDLNQGSQTTTHHYVVVRVTPDTPHWVHDLLKHLPIDTPIYSQDTDESLTSELDSRCQEVQSTIDTGDLTATRLDQTRLDQLLERLEHRYPNPDTRWTTQPVDGVGQYRKTLVLTSYPSNLELAWPLTLLHTPGRVDITQHIIPRNPGDTAKQLRRTLEKLNAEIDSYLRQGYRGTNKLDRLVDDTQWILDLLANREDQPVDYSVAVTAHHPDRSRCQQTFDQLTTRLDTKQIGYNKPVFQTYTAHQHQDLFQHAELGNAVLMPARSAAAGYPFATQTTEQETGVVYGEDTSDDTPIILDRYSWSSHSTAVMGMVGSGKSYLTKLELLRTYHAYKDLQIYIVDPKNEYTALIEELDGELYTLGQELQLGFKTSDVIGYQVPDRGDQDNIDLLVDVVQDIYDFASRHTRKTLVIIDEARILLNDDRGRQVLNQFVLEARDTNTAITLVTQNASHFTHSREGREILDNMPGKIFLRHDRVPDSVVDYFDLSQREKQELFELDTGTDTPSSEALLRVSNRVKTRVDVQSTSAEHALIDNGGHQS